MDIATHKWTLQLAVFRLFAHGYLLREVGFMWEIFFVILFRPFIFHCDIFKRMPYDLKNCLE